MRADLRLALVACSCALALACGEPRFEYLSFAEASDPPIDVQLGENDLVLVEGIAVGTRVSAIDDAGDPMPVLTFESEDPDILGVARGPALGRWVFYGIAPGETRVEVHSDGERVGRVRVTVEAQD